MGVRVHLGRLDSFTGGVNDFGLLLKRGILGTGTNTTVDDDGLSVSLSGVERVRVGALGGGDYGLKVTNAGSTVIIDGTSQMFKVAASGTLSGTASFGTNVAVESVTLTGLGTLSEVPAHLSYLSQSTSVTTERNLGTGTLRTDHFASLSSGGTVNQSQIGILAFYRILTKLSASPGNAVVALWIHNHSYSGTDQTAYGRYYVLAETAT